MRSEQFERLRRRLTANPEHGFTTAAPWSAVYVYAQAIKEDAFWQREVVTPATLRLAAGSGRPGGEGMPSRALSDLESIPTGARDSKKRKKDDEKAKHDGQKWTHNRKGVEICEKWNQGKCGVDKPESKCSAKPPRSHQCNLCLGPHAAKDCKKPR